jgi:hypothetical protein
MEQNYVFSSIKYPKIHRNAIEPGKLNIEAKMF